jgi:hypothetical protein
MVIPDLEIYAAVGLGLYIDRASGIPVSNLAVVVFDSSSGIVGNAAQFSSAAAATNANPQYSFPSEYSQQPLRLISGDGKGGLFSVNVDAFLGVANLDEYNFFYINPGYIEFKTISIGSTVTGEIVSYAVATEEVPEPASLAIFVACSALLFLKR